MADETPLRYLLEQLKTDVVAHYRLISGAGKEENQLESELRLMKAAVRKYSQSLSRGEIQREYETELRDVVHEAEDILDECLTRAALEKANPRMFRSRYLSQSHGRLANQVITFRQNTIKPTFVKHNISPVEQPSPPPPPPPITTQPYGQGSPKRGTGRTVLVGLEEKAETIINFLTEESEQLEVISITGMPGLGKTTLARKLYHCKRVRTHFPTVIWVDVSQKFQKRKVFVSILETLAKVDIPSMSDDELATTIQLYLKNQKFLVIFDDVWKEEDWEAIEPALPTANSLGRVLITSRIESMAVIANPRRNPYKLGFLDGTESWNLLQLRVFGNLYTCPPELDDLGREIARGCCGLPLAIVIIAGVLLKIRSTPTGDNEARIQWNKVSRSVHQYISDENNKRMDNVIALSYYDLPFDLRDCFLYLGIFPGESRIPIRRLIRMWIAEGFILPKPYMSLEEVANNNLNELIDRNLVMVDNFKPNGSIKTCRLHSLIREFCKHESSLQNLFQEMEMSASEGTFCPPVSDIKNRRRICIHSHIEVFLKQDPQGPRVHSLLCSAKEAVTSLPAHTSPIPQRFKRLRVVDVTPIKLTEFPSNLTTLIHLRYIALSGHGDDLWALPEAVSSLWNLQSITIETNCRTFEIKANLWAMMHLRHLKTKAAIVLHHKYLKGPAGDQLQSVSRLSTKSCTEAVFDKAKNIHNLGICGDLNTILEVCSLRKLLRLQKLKLVHDAYPVEASEKPLSRLPNHDIFPPNLTILQLSGTFLTWNEIRVLQNLGALVELKLKNNAFMGKYWLAHDGCFASLEILFIADTDLDVWTAQDGYFPNLKCLVLKNCNQLQEIPFELNTKNLKILDVENVKKSAVDSARIIAEENVKMQGQQSGGRGGFKLIITDS